MFIPTRPGIGTSKESAVDRGPFHSGQGPYPSPGTTRGPGSNESNPRPKARRFSTFSFSLSNPRHIPRRGSHMSPCFFVGMNELCHLERSFRPQRGRTTQSKDPFHAERWRSPVERVFSSGLRCPLSPLSPCHPEAPSSGATRIYNMLHSERAPPSKGAPKPATVLRNNRYTSI